VIGGRPRGAVIKDPVVLCVLFGFFFGVWVLRLLRQQDNELWRGRPPVAAKKDQKKI
jgi:hypothetical protein